MDGARVLTDPLLRDRVAHLRRHVPSPDLSRLGPPDAVLLSHLHLDHCDLPSLRRLCAGVRLLVPRGAGPFLGRLSRGKVVVSATVAEELAEGRATERVAERVSPDFAVISEATSLKVAHGQRGRAELQAEVFGSATHSSRPDLGVNAAEAMTDAVRALREVPVPRHEVLGEGILALTDVISRPYPGLSAVPGYCKATFDRRALPGETEGGALAPVREALGRALEGTGATGEVSISEDEFECYTGAEVRARNLAPAWYYDGEDTVVRRPLEGLGYAGLPERKSYYAFCTNGSGAAGRLGIPTVGFGPGDEEMAHRVDEYIEVCRMVGGARGYAAIAERLTAEEAGR